MTRISPLLLAVLLAGVVLGMVLERGISPPVSQALSPSSSPSHKGGRAVLTVIPAPVLHSPKGVTDTGKSLVTVSGPPAANVGVSGVVAAGESASPEALQAQLEQSFQQFQQINRTFELVVRTVAPTVVHIVAVKSRVRNEVTYRYEESGSGVMVHDPRGTGHPGTYVLTNHHVVQGAPVGMIKVTLNDGRVFQPERIWLDRQADIAVLKLTRDDLPTARLGDSDTVPIGTWVIAVGSPFGLTHSFTQGIISARGRHEQDLEADGVVNQDFLQTDAAINPGNSGGPLVNMRGDIVGINTAIASNGGGSEGVGFSIPINLAKWIMTQLITQGKVTRGALGIDQLENVNPEVAIRLGLDRPRGVLVQSVRPKSPAAEARIRAGDVVIKFNGVDIADYNQLINLLSMAPVGRAAELVVWREQATVSLQVVIADREMILGGNTSGNDSVTTSPEGYIQRPRRPPNRRAPSSPLAPRNPEDAPLSPDVTPPGPP